MTFRWVAEAVAASRLALQGHWADVQTSLLATAMPPAIAIWAPIERATFDETEQAGRRRFRRYAAQAEGLS